MGPEDPSEDYSIRSQGEKPLEFFSRGMTHSGLRCSFSRGTLSRFEIQSIPGKSSVPGAGLLCAWPHLSETTSTQDPRAPVPPGQPRSHLHPRPGPRGWRRLRALHCQLLGCAPTERGLTAAVGSLCVQATGSRSFQSVSPSSWSVRRKQDPVDGSWAPSIHLLF